MGLFEAQIVILRWFDRSLTVAQKGLPLYVPLSPSVCLSVYLSLYSLLSLSCSTLPSLPPLSPTVPLPHAGFKAPIYPQSGN